MPQGYHAPMPGFLICFLTILPFDPQFLKALNVGFGLVGNSARLLAMDPLFPVGQYAGQLFFYCARLIFEIPHLPQDCQFLTGHRRHSRAEGGFIVIYEIEQELIFLFCLCAHNLATDERRQTLTRRRSLKPALALPDYHGLLLCKVYDSGGIEPSVACVEK